MAPRQQSEAGQTFMDHVRAQHPRFIEAVLADAPPDLIAARRVRRPRNSAPGPWSGSCAWP